MPLLDAVRTFSHRWYKALEARDHDLLYLFLEITRRCNLRCLHCGSDCRNEPGGPELSTDSWVQIIEYVRHHFGATPFFVITGGEPLLHPDLAAIGAAIRDRGMKWGMVTNGLAMTGRHMNELARSGLGSITISLDGDAQTHGWLRANPHSYDRACEAIRLAAGAGLPHMDVVTCVNPRNLDQLPAIAERLLELGVPAWRLFRIFPSGRAADNPDLLLDRDRTWRMIAWIRDNRPSLASRGLTVDLSCEGWLPMSLDRRVRSRPFFCRAGINIASILSDGAITGCSNNHPSFAQGNILRDDFATVWEKGFCEFRKREWVTKTACAGCRWVKECGGGAMHLWKAGGRETGFCVMASCTNWPA